MFHGDKLSLSFPEGKGYETKWEREITKSFSNISKEYPVFFFFLSSGNESVTLAQLK